MKKAILCLLFLFFVSLAFGQANSKLAKNQTFTLEQILKEAAEASDFSKKEKFYNRALVLSKDNDLFFIKTIHQYAEDTRLSGNFFKTGELLNKAKMKVENSENLHLMAMNNYLIGRNYDLLNDFDQSVKYLIISKNQFTKLRDVPSQIKTSIALGIVYWMKNQNELARKEYEFSLEKANLIDSKGEKAKIFSNIAYIFEKEKNIDSALFYIEKSLSSMQTNQKDLHIGNLIEKAYLLFLKKDFKQSISIGYQSLELCDSNNLDFTSYAHRVLYRSFRELNIQKDALYHFEKYQELRENLDQVAKSSQIRNLNTIYENDKKEKELEILDSQLKIQKYWRNTLIIGTLILSLFLVIVYSSRKKINNQKKKIENYQIELESINDGLENEVKNRTIEISNANAELIKKNFEITEALFKGQTIERKRVAAELHDNLGSTLSALKWRLEALNAEALIGKEKEIYFGIKKMMESAYSDVRNISHNLLPKEFEINGLIGGLEKLTNEINEGGILRINFERKGNFQDLALKYSLEIYSICLELITNLLKHSNAKNAILSMNREENSIKIIIADDGVGFDPNKISSGNGLKNINERLNSIGGKLAFVESNIWNSKIRIEFVLNQCF